MNPIYKINIIPYAKHLYRFINYAEHINIINLFEKDQDKVLASLDPKYTKKLLYSDGSIRRLYIPIIVHSELEAHCLLEHYESMTDSGILIIDDTVIISDGGLYMLKPTHRIPHKHEIALDTVIDIPDKVPMIPYLQ